MKRLLCLCAVLLTVGCESTPAPADNTASQLTATSDFDPQAVFDSRCAHCHDGSVPKAPHIVKFPLIGSRAIEATLTSGLMQMHVEGLTDDEVTSLANHLGGVAAVQIAPLTCDQQTLAPASAPLRGWSLNPEGTRYIPAEVAQLSAAQVADLQVKWVFAYPGATRARSQPVPYGDAVLVGSQSGAVYALNLETGCAHWTFNADVEVRSAIAINATGDRAYFGDLKGQIYAIDPRNGALLWRTLANDHPDVTITGSPRLHEDTLYVPLSSSEWASAADPGYGCCTFRGGVVAIDAGTGEIRWTAYSIPEAPAPTGQKNELGVALYHPAGAPIWNNPTIDAKRNQLLVGTGEAYTSPAADTSDSVLAFDLDTGALNWKYQSIAGDAWNMACFIGGGANCPVEDGPDLDIGAPPMLVTINGRDLVVAGQKSGHVFALDPATGELAWRKKIGRGGFAGGIHWGMASAGGQIFAPNADTVFTGRFTGPRKPGLFALDAASGATQWFTPAADVCAEADKPACDPGLSAAVTAIDAVVFAGAFDGHLRAYDAATGNVLWDFNTNREFRSVSGELAQGGSIEADGPVVYKGHVLVNSGYLFGDRMPGNALVVFAPGDG